MDWLSFNKRQECRDFMLSRSVTVPLIQIVFSILGIIVVVIVLLFPCVDLSLLILTALILPALTLPVNGIPGGFCSVKLYLQKLE